MVVVVVVVADHTRFVVALWLLEDLLLVVASVVAIVDLGLPIPRFVQIAVGFDVF